MSIYTAYTIFTLAVVAAVGIPYAIYIAFRPFDDGWTWLSVAIGVILTITPFSFAMYRLTGNMEMALSIWVFFLVSGIPMMLGQIIKHVYLSRKTRRTDDPQAK